MQKQVERKFKIELMVTRHGQTVQNKKKIICGQNPGKLTQQGIEQAQKIGEHLKTHYFDKIYVSDLGRTKQTFQNIKLKAENLKNIQVKYQSLIRQKHGGILTGSPLITWQKQAAKQKKTIREYKCKDGQSWVDVNKRVHKFIEKIIRQNALQIQNPKLQQKILVICHGGYIMQLHNVCKVISSKGKQKATFTNSAHNCSIHVFELQYNLEQNKKQYKLDKLSIKCTLNNFKQHLNK